MAQRVGAKIAELPPEKRQVALAIVEKSLRETVKKTNLTGPQADGFVELQMKAIRHFITEIDVSGNPRSGGA